jgi:hypothetical protein
MINNDLRQRLLPGAFSISPALPLDVYLRDFQSDAMQGKITVNRFFIHPENIGCVMR